LGCFIGGKSYVLYRAYVHGYFRRAGLPLEFYSQNLDAGEFERVPEDPDAYQNMRKRPDRAMTYGKVTGKDIVAAMEAGLLDAGTVGESSFIEAGAPIVAVAALAHDVKERPGKAIVLRRGVVIRRPEDFKGKVLVSRRSGPGGDAIFLKEFLESIGLDWRQDATVLENEDESATHELIKSGRADGGLYHVEMAVRLVREGLGDVYRPMDWIDPELSLGLIVFRKDFVSAHPDEVAKFVRAYAEQVRDENRLSPEERAKETRKGLRLTNRFRGMDLPQCDDPPLVRLEPLVAMQKLLLKYGIVDKTVDLKPFIDGRFLDEVKTRE
jgi:ABC-type nitrate/sulfonate/bicarbonate transport system substrate-binding protein